MYGYPVTDTRDTADGAGVYNDFTERNGFGASIYWTPETGANGVQGLIRDRWLSLGRGSSYLGYPISDEFAIPGGRQSDFQGGFIRFDAATGAVTDQPY